MSPTAVIERLRNSIGQLKLSRWTEPEPDRKKSASVAEITVKAGDVAFERMLKSITLVKPAWPYKRKPAVDLPANTEAPLPSVYNYKRISGVAATADPRFERFLDRGYEQAKNFVNIAEVWGVEFTTNLTVMDWGVGCGRIGRHMPEAVRPNFIGIDVDPVNITWCKNNMSFGRYEVTGTEGPLPLPDASVDVIYSHSVLTHLDRVHQEIWLRELARVIKPNGLMMLTVHGLHSSAAVAKWAHNPKHWFSFFDRSFIDAASPNLDISDVTPADYYRDVAHTPVYVANYWPLWGIEVLEIMPGGCGPSQDVIVCTRQT